MIQKIYSLINSRNPIPKHEMEYAPTLGAIMKLTLKHKKHAKKLIFGGDVPFKRFSII
jgi:hypothetical protein